MQRQGGGFGFFDGPLTNGMLGPRGGDASAGPFWRERDFTGVGATV